MRLKCKFPVSVISNNNHFDGDSVKTVTKVRHACAGGDNGHM